MQSRRHTPEPSNRHARRGGILLEVVLAIALFAGAAAFALASVRSVFRTLEQARLLQEAIDLARSKMSELEAGLITLADLRGNDPQQIGSIDLRDALRDDAYPWRIEVTTQRTEFTGLSLVELTITPSNPSAEPTRYSLRQLVALRETGAEGYEAEIAGPGAGGAGGSP
jgi:type II secretory pathway pseudopilin PulG